MESSPRPEQLEHAQAPDLFALYGEKQATIFGMTASLYDLGKLCPIDLNDPSVSLESKNDFVIKAANESGMEIAQKHEELFSRRLEVLGVEPKFKVEPPAKPERSEHVPKDISPRPTPPKERVISEVAAAELLVRSAERQAVEASTTTEVAAAESSLDVAEDVSIAIAWQRAAELAHQAETEGAEIARSTDGEVEMTLPAVVQQPERPVPVMDQPVPKINLPEMQSAVETTTLSAEAVIVEPAIATSEPSASQPEVSLSSPDEQLGMMLPYPEEQSIAAAETEVRTDPAEIFESWLSDVLATHESGLETSEVPEEPGILNTADQAPEWERPIALLREVATSLAELPAEEKEALSPVFHEVLAVAQYIQALEADEDVPTDKEQATLRLANLCRSLLDSLECEYEEEDIHRLVALLVAEAKTALPLAESKDEIPADAGTHERKYFMQLTGDFRTKSYLLQRVLGMAALSSGSVAVLSR